jgi:hypothetical protein
MTASTPGAKKFNKTARQWSSRPIEMLESPAWCALSLSAHRIIDRCCIELAHHGGNDNGKLPVTYDNFEAYNVHRHCIGPAIREAVALGFLQVTIQGVAGNANHRSPNLFRVTFANALNTPATHEWRRIKTKEEAEAIANAARKSGPGRRWRVSKSKTKSSGGKRTDTSGGKRTEKRKSQ